MLPYNKKYKFISFFHNANSIVSIVAIRFTQKPISTDMIGLADSCHPQRHKHAALRYGINTKKCCLLDRKKKYKKSKITRDTLI
jgi:hypothetical protein